MSELKEMGENGNTGAFRNVPRQRLIDREPKSIAPKSTHYSPNYTCITNPITKNIQFGDLG